MLCGRNRRQKHFCEHLLQGFHWVNLDALAQHSLARILRRNEYLLQPGPARGFHLGRYAAHGLDPPLYGDFSGAGRRAVHWLARERTHRHHCHGHPSRGAIHRCSAGEVDMQIPLPQVKADFPQQRAHILRGSPGSGLAAHAPAFLAHFFLFHNARHRNLSAARQGYSLNFHDRTLMRTVNRQAMDGAHAGRGIRALGRAHRIVPGLHHPLHVLSGDVGAILQLRQAGTHLHNVHRVPATGRVAPHGFRLRSLHGVSGARGGSQGNIRNLFRFQCSEKHLHAP